MAQLSRMNKGNRVAKRPIRKYVRRSKAGTWSVLGIMHGGHEGKQWIQAKDNVHEYLKKLRDGIDIIKAEVKEEPSDNAISKASNKMNRLADDIGKEFKSNVYKYEKLSGWDSNILVNYYKNKASSIVLEALREINK